MAQTYTSGDARLVGKPLIATRPIRWSFTRGVTPYQTIVEVPPDDAPFFDSVVGQPLTLDFNPSGGGNPLTINHVYILGRAGGHIVGETLGGPSACFLISDRRWMWSRPWVRRWMNIRRRVGNLRLLGNQLVPANISPDIIYAHFSTLDGKGKIPWNPSVALRSILSEVDPTAVFFDGTGIDGRQISFEDITIDDPGDRALQRILSFLPGIYTWIDKNGAVRLGDGANGIEAQILKNAPAAIEGTPLVAYVDSDKVRAANVKVLFDREVEVRLDFRQHETFGSGPGFVLGYQASLRTRQRKIQLENVLPVTDIRLIVAGRELAEGSIMTFQEAFTAWLAAGPALPVPLAGQTVLTEELVQKCYNSGLLYTMAGAGIKGLNPDPIWIRRIDAIYKHYRKTFRIIPEIRDGFSSIRATRVSILDPENGVYALAQVYADHYIEPTRRALAGLLGDQELGMNVDGYDELIADASPAPARAVVLDEAQGIIHLEFEVDPFGHQAEVLPSQVRDIVSLFPNSNTVAAKAASQKYEYSPAYCELSKDHGVAVILTVMQAAPNSLKALYSVTVMPAEARIHLPRAIGNASGPPVYLRVSGAFATARFPWLDDNDIYVDDLFGFHPGGPTSARVPLPQAANPALFRPVNEDELKDIARAIAAEYYSTVLPHYEGTHSSDFYPAAELDGSITMVSHELSTRGVLSTQVTCSQQSSPLDMMGFLPDGVRKIYQRLVQL